MRSFRNTIRYLQYYAINVLSQYDLYFSCLIAILLVSFPVIALYKVSSCVEESVHILDAWLLTFSNTRLHFYFTVLFVFLISRVPFRAGFTTLMAMRTGTMVAYYAPLIFSICVAFFMLAGAAIISMIAVLPIAYPQNQWSMVIRLLDQVNVRLNLGISFSAPQSLISNMKPVGAFAYSFFQVFMLWTFFAQIMFISCLCNKKYMGYVMIVTIVLIGWLFILFGEHTVLLLISPIHHAFPHYAFFSSRLDLYPVGTIVYFIILNWLLFLCIIQRYPERVDTIL